MGEGGKCRIASGSPDAIDAYVSRGRVVGGSRDEMLDALYGAWKAGHRGGQDQPDDRRDLGTVGELNARAQADRIAAGSVSGDGVTCPEVRRPGSVTRS